MEAEPPAAEVYGTTETDGQHVMSDRVKTLAGSIYEEFEHMIKKYDEDVVKELMPLVVGILETLDGSYTDKQENEVELELLREDNQQLLAQYDREKQLRKTSEQKLLEVEDIVEEERKKTEEKLENLESLVRTLELKGKNASDHATRLEEKEAEMKKEYNKLHERYTDLFKTHMDYLERTKSVMYGEKGDMVHSPRGKGFMMPTLRPVHIHHQTVHVTEVLQKSTQPPGGAVAQEIEHDSDLQSEMRGAVEPESESMNRGDAQHAQTSTLNVSNTETGKEQQQQHGGFEILASSDMQRTADEELRKTMAEIVETTPELEDFDDASYGSNIGSVPGTSHRPQLTEQDSIFDELNHEDSDIIGEFDDGADITGMGKEVENLIEENTELLATKNALNIVKDDLIAQVDELASEVEMVRGEVRSLRALTDRYKERINELEEHLKKQKEEFEARRRGGDEDDENLSRAQRKRFTRVEMARVLMERNQYKERLMELQEAVRWTEMIRASREHPELSADKQKDSKSGIWNFFGNLFGDGGSSETDKKPAATPNKIKYTKGPGLPKHI